MADLQKKCQKAIKQIRVWPNSLFCTWRAKSKMKGNAQVISTNYNMSSVSMHSSPNSMKIYFINMLHLWKTKIKCIAHLNMVNTFSRNSNLSLQYPEGCTQYIFYHSSQHPFHRYLTRNNNRMARKASSPSHAFI